MIKNVLIFGLLIMSVTLFGAYNVGDIVDHYCPVISQITSIG